MNLETFFFKQA